ncbi:hypothetical protein F4679DRAFT_584222 [Xylaria curta]|nr:hypothetical protein F4679DRAFT_584222 [Xylaria curta]
MSEKQRLLELTESVGPLQRGSIVPSLILERTRTAILKHEKEGKPFFRLDEIARIQNYLSSAAGKPGHLFSFQDSFGNQQSYVSKYDNGTPLVELRSLQYSITHVHEFGIEIPLYSPGLVKGNPAIAVTNESLVEEGAAHHALDPRKYPDSMNLARVREIFNEARDQYHKSKFPAIILKALSDIEQRIDNVVCFDLGTFEADVCGSYANTRGAPRCTTHHLLALMIRDYVAAVNLRRTVPLIFQASEYTDDTVTVLEGLGCVVLRDNTTAFNHITENSLVIWTGKEGPMPVPVKQVIADFPFQATPLPLPRAMLWPEEEPTHIQDVLEPVKILKHLPYTPRWASLSTMDTPRTNQLHNGYDRHRLPSLPDYDPFDFRIKALALYTRKERVDIENRLRRHL